MASLRDYSEEMCQEAHVHETVLEQVKSQMPDDDTLCDVSEMFKVFGDMTRTKILSALFEAERNREDVDLCSQPPASYPASDQDCQEPPLRQRSVLFPGR